MKYKQTLGFFAVSLFLCVVIRSFELIYIVDSKTGFLKEQYRTIGIFAVVVIIAAIIALSAISAAVFRKPKQPPEINLPMSFSCFALSVLTVYSLLTMPQSQQGAPLQRKLLVFFSILYAAFLLVYAFKSIKDFRLPGAAYIIPVAFWIVKLMSDFTKISAISLITENVFNILSGCCVTVFMLEFSRFEAFGKKECNFKLLSSGIASTMLCAVSSVSPLCAAAVRATEQMHESIVNIFTFLFTAIFIATFVFTNFKDDDRVSYKHSR